MPRLTPRRTLTALLLLLALLALPRLLPRATGARVQHGLHHALAQLTPARAPSRHLVISAAAGRGEEVEGWVGELGEGWAWTVYKDGELGALPGRGGAAVAYLTWILEHYEEMPETAVFVRGGRYAWWNDDPIYDIVPQLTALRPPAVLAAGYAPLRCAWRPGCPAALFPRTPLPHAAAASPLLAAAERHFASAWAAIFPGEPLPAAVGAPAGAQFAVSRAAVGGRPREVYERARRWLLETEVEGEVCEVVFEYLWHVLFQKPSVHCPPAEQCYCELYGHCNLTCSLGECEGRYVLPPQTDVPEGWPERGGGENGWPVVGWNKEFAGGEDEEKQEASKLERGGRRKGGKLDEASYEISTAKQGEWRPE